MNLLPKAFGNRPRLACEIAAGGVVAGRSPAPGAPLTAVARVDLAEGAIVPGLKPGNVADRVATIAAVRRALEGIGARPNARNADLTLVIPDGAVRVLLLDFDALPGKLTEALPIVRFRLKRLVPFDTDTAMVSFQVMSSTRSAVRVLAIAIPRDVLSDYETVAREAGFEPGAVLPSTLAALAALPESEGGLLTVNVYSSAVTTAIVRGGILLLHRTVELTEGAVPEAANLSAASPKPEIPANFDQDAVLPLVDRDETAGEWAAQQPLPEFGRNPYADAIAAEEAVEDEDGITAMPSPGSFEEAGVQDGNAFVIPEFRLPYRRPRGEQAGPFDEVNHSPYAAASVTDDLQAEIHNSFLTRPPVPDAFGAAAAGSPGSGEEEISFDDLVELGRDEPARVHTLAPDARAEEIARAVSVAVAYFEDVLNAPPEILFSAGPLGADQLNRTLEEQGLAQELGLRSRELVEPASLAAEATTATVPRGLLAGVVGALRS